MPSKRSLGEMLQPDAAEQLALLFDEEMKKLVAMERIYRVGGALVAAARGHGRRAATASWISASDLEDPLHTRLTCLTAHAL